MKFIVVALFSALILNFAFAKQPIVKTGIEVLREQKFEILAGKRVGLITNPTGVDSRLKSTIDILKESGVVQLVALYGPEHGVRGDHAAGNKVESSVDERTNVPVYSLYGSNRKPTAEMLKNVDVLVYDIQDIGARSYTYISTMGLTMEAAAERGIEFVVLDRPNPLGGLKIEGNVLDTAFASFVGQFPIPYVYGMTCGELARMLNEEQKLAGGIQCKLTVVPMEGWNRSIRFEETGLPWVPTSPHIPEAESPQYYVSTGIMGELGVLSEGVGYTLPFHMCAAPWIDAEEFAEKLNALAIDGVLFRPVTFKPFYGKYQDQVLKGVEIHITDYDMVDLLSLQFILMEVHHQLYPDKNPFAMAEPRLKMFDKVCGTDEIRRIFTKRMRYDDIKPILSQDIESFRERSSKYYLYK